jgi:hypothetical protein
MYTDAATNQSNTVTRTVTVTEAPDTVSPVITLSGSTNMTILKDALFTDPGATCTDNRDTTCTVTVSGSVNTAVTGNYSIVYSAKDTANNNATSLTRTVTVTLAPDTTAPVITVSGEAIMNIYVGSGFTDPGATCTDDRDVSCTVTVSGSVNTTQTGAYILIYSARDTANNTATGKTRTVNVIPQSVIPNLVITLTGAQIATGSVNISSGTLVVSGTLIDLAGFPIIITNSGGSLSISGSTDIVVASGSWDGTLTAPVAVTGALALQSSEVGTIT